MENISKMNKKGLVDYIKATKESVKDKSILDMVTYTLDKLAESSKNIAKQDLYELAQDIKASLDGTQQALPMENAVKKPVKPVEDKEPTKEEKPKVSKANKKAKEDKPKVSKPKKDKPVVTAKEVPNKKQIELAEQFPETVETELGKLKVDLATQSVEDLKKLLDAGTTVVFAMYWTKRHLKQFPYDIFGVNKTKYKEFPNDLDLLVPLHVSEDGRVVYAISVYSEVMYTILPQELKIEDGMRFNNGIEYNLYTVED